MQDLERAKLICNKESKPTEKMHSFFYDRVMYKASQFESKNIYHDGYWITDKGIRATDSVVDTYLFLMKHLIKKACKYKGIKGATLNTFLTSILNNPFTKSEWRKSKFGGLVIPKVIICLSKEHHIVFRSLKHKEPIELIAVKIDKPLPETEIIIIEVKNALEGAGMIDLIEKPFIIGLTNFLDEDDKEEDIEDCTSSPISELSYGSEIASTLLDCFSKIDKDDRRLIRLYWDTRLTTKRIFTDYFQNENSLIKFKDIKISKESDINNNINRIIKLYDSIFKEKYFLFYKEANLNIKATKLALKILIENWDVSKKNILKENIN